MCGIVGYVGPRETVGVLMEGLRRLEDKIRKLNIARKTDKLAQVKFFELVDVLNNKYKKGITFLE